MGNIVEQSSPFSSADFWRVPDRLQANPPARLIHRAVMGSQNQITEAFSDERRHPVQVVDLPSRTLSMTIGRLLALQTSRCHRHNYESLIYMCEGSGVTFIEGRPVEWEKGDAVYIPVWAWHYHQNRADTECLYIACENAPLLQNLGNIALREERS